MRTLLTLLLCFIAFRDPLAAQASAASEGIVVVQVLTFVGDWLDDAVVTLRERGTKQQTGAFIIVDTRHTAKRIPYGEYTLHVRRAGFREHEQIVKMYQPRVSLRVFLRLANTGDTDLTELIGIVAPTPAKNDKLWVKILPLLSTEVIGEAEVESKGQFRFTGLDEGEYVLVVMRGTQSIYMKQIKLYGVTKVTLQMSSG